MKTKKTAFIPGFENEDDARKAGAKFYAKTNGRKGIEGKDFHLIQNEYGRWHFAEGPRNDLFAWNEAIQKHRS